ncbi:MAG: TIGR00266 family protein [Candidatus Altiarchaeales archaeon]|nr:TIGR00266 family protein [Candidatus Altiarchaeales archaeon]MBD3415548.1 TIGR00266 family protein [Candidatus Altiarchaeales archaeon]
MKYTIRGSVLQVVDIELAQGQSVYTESGGMAWMSNNFDMKTDTKGGLIKGLTRAMSGESLFMTTYTCNGGTGIISFVNEFPGKIIPLELAEGQSLICQKDAFMCAESSVTLEMHFRKKLGAGLFGGEGFIMQKVTGPGTVFLELAGDVTEYSLEPGQELKVDPGHLGLYDPEVNFDITRVKGVKNILFGGEGLFLASVKGPGRVWLQSMPIPNLASKILRYIPRSR